MAIESSFNDNQTKLTLTVKGSLDVFAAGDLSQALTFDTKDEENKFSKLKQVIVDLDGVEVMESASIAVLSVSQQLLEREAIELTLENVAEKHLEMMKQIPAAKLDREEPNEKGSFEIWGSKLYGFYDTAAEFIALMYDATMATFKLIKHNSRPPKGAITEQCVACGVNALGIILLLSALIGLILGFQAAYQLAQFGASIYIADLVGISGVREFSPLMTAIIIAGRSGASIAAELGTMKVQEEIDALKSMGLNPLRFLVLPRIAALVITLPALTLLSCFIVIAGGMTIGNLMLGIQISAYIEQTIKVIQFGDWVFGISKSFVFAWIISLVGCFCGMSIRGGASEVGNATTKSVVASIFLLIVIDSFFATMSTLFKL